MVESGSVQVASAPKPAKAKAPKTKKTGSKPSHPPTSQLVNAAIRAMKERGGSSLQAIKKYIALNNKVDADKLAPFIRKYLKKATASGKLVQTKGKGASGSFKLSAASLKPKGEKKKKKTAAKKAAKPKTAKAKKATKPKTKLAPKQKSLKPLKSKLKAPKPKKAQAKKPVTAAKKAAKPAAK